MSGESPRLRPLVKWPGGKGRLVPKLRPLMPENLSGFTQYVEPFLGGGAIFLSLLSEEAFPSWLVSDSNPRLMGLYRTVRDMPDSLLDKLEAWELQYANQDWDERRETYLARREEFNTLPPGPESAALLLYLNRTCFNGLYRENSKGGFNSPMGKYENPRIADAENVLAMSRALAKVTLESLDFQALETQIHDDAFVMLDPPYHPQRADHGYTTYRKGEFDASSQERLRDFLVRLDGRGVKWMLSNSDSGDGFIEGLYAGYDIQHITAPRSIGAASATRKMVGELVIRNY